MLEIAFDSTLLVYYQVIMEQTIILNRRKNVSGNIDFGSAYKTINKTGKFSDGNTIAIELTNKFSLFPFSYDNIQVKITITNNFSNKKEIQFVYYQQISLPITDLVEKLIII